MEMVYKLLFPYPSQTDPFLALEVCLKMALAILFSGIIGWERETNDQPAGLRTHIILCLGSTMMTIVSIRAVEDLGGVEPTRIMAQIVSGIGFLGAGAIMRLGLTVRGLTTATTLWSIAGVGLAVGAGYYLPAFIAVSTMYIVLHYFDALAAYAISGHNMHLSVIAKSDPGCVGEVEALLMTKGVQIRSLRAHARTKKGTIEIEGLVKLPPQVDPGQVVEALLEMDYITESYLS